MTSRSSDWPVISLGDCIVWNEANYSSKDSWPFVSYLDTGNIKENRIFEIQHLVVGRDKIPARARRKATSGDIVYSTVRPSQRHFGLLRKVPENFLVSTGFCVFRGKQGYTDTEFVYWYLSQDHIVDWLHTIADQSTSAYPSVRPTDIERLVIALPPLDEQHAIAHVLGTLDDKIELNQRMNETLEAMVQAIFKDWFVDFGPVLARMEGREPYLPADLWNLFPDALDDGGKPIGWMPKTLSELFQVKIGRTPPRKEQQLFVSHGTGETWLSIRAMANQQTFISDSEEDLTPEAVKRFRVPLIPAGTVLVSFKLTVGRVAIAATDMYSNEAIAQLQPTSNTPISCPFTYCFMKSFDFHRLSSTSSIATAVNSRSIKAIEMLIPDCEVHDAFHAIAQPIFGQILRNSRETKTLMAIRDIVLPKLISGQIRVMDTESDIRQST